MKAAVKECEEDDDDDVDDDDDDGDTASFFHTRLMTSDRGVAARYHLVVEAEDPVSSHLFH